MKQDGAQPNPFGHADRLLLQLKHHSYQTTAMHDYILSTYADPIIALFDSHTWNVYGMSDRTINICEGFHCALNRAVSVRHPSVYRLIQVLQDIEAVRLSRPANNCTACIGCTAKKENKSMFRLLKPCSVRMCCLWAFIDATAFQLWDVKH